MWYASHCQLEHVWEKDCNVLGAQAHPDQHTKRGNHAQILQILQRHLTVESLWVLVSVLWCRKEVENLGLFKSEYINLSGILPLESKIKGYNAILYIPHPILPATYLIATGQNVTSYKMAYFHCSHLRT